MQIVIITWSWAFRWVTPHNYDRSNALDMLYMMWIWDCRLVLWHIKKKTRTVPMFLLRLPPGMSTPVRVNLPMENFDRFHKQWTSEFKGLPKHQKITRSNNITTAYKLNYRGESPWLMLNRLCVEIATNWCGILLHIILGYVWANSLLYILKVFSNSLLDMCAYLAKRQHLMKMIIVWLQATYSPQTL